MAEIALGALKGMSYTAFINEAFSRSDYATYVVMWPADEFRFYDKNDYIKLGYTEDFYEYMYDLRKKEYDQSKQIFEEKCLTFLKASEPYHLNGEKLSKEKTRYSVRMTPEVLKLFLEPGATEDWVFDRYPCDLCFVSGHKYWFVSNTHGQTFAELYPDSEEDYCFWRDQGVVFMRNYDYINDVVNRPSV